MSGGALIIGLPSKGRIHDKTLSYLGDAGLTVARNGAARGYTASLKPLADAEVLLMSAGEIAGAIESGTVHVGVTGLDLLEERAGGTAGRIEVLVPLGFARAQVVVAVPQAWLDVDTVADLVEVSEGFVEAHAGRLRVATKFRHLTRRFFARHGLIDYRIIDSLGATEGAPAAGTADIIVDITETGSTLAANQLKILADGAILDSQAVIAASRMAPWTQAARAGLKQLLAMVEAKAASRDVCEIRLRAVAGRLEAAVAAAQAHGARLLSVAGDAAVILCPRTKLYGVIDRLYAEGAEDAAVTQPDFVFSSQPGAFERFVAGLGAKP